MTLTRWQGIASATVNDHSTRRSEFFTDPDGNALNGHDPVAYFTIGEPTKGDPGIRRDWSGATWLFASTANRDLFDTDPDRYAPAFGGHCAVASAFGLSLPGSAKRWRIEDGRLYINKNVLAQALFGLLARRIRRLGSDPDPGAARSATREASE